MAKKTNALLIGTRKGAFVLRKKKSKWKLSEPRELGTKVFDFQQDAREPNVLLHTGGGFHLGPTVFRSTDEGATWTEATEPPKFHTVANEGDAPQSDGTSRGLAVKSNFWLAPGHADEPGTWYVGTAPQGLFRSTDGGATWSGVDGFNLNAKYKEWTVDPDTVPDGSFLHSVLVDPRDAKHLFLSMSIGGTFESTDAGATWKPVNENVQVLFGPEKYPEHGQDPHCVIQHPANPDRLYQQNHCGIYSLDLAKGRRWEHIGANMPEGIGDIGFGVVGHPRREDTVWVMPMDGTSVWPRTAPGGKLAMYRTDDGGSTWKRLAKGLPQENAWFTAKRQALCTFGDPKDPAVCFGATCGEVWFGHEGGSEFEQIAKNLPEIYSLYPAVLS